MVRSLKSHKEALSVNRRTISISLLLGLLLTFAPALLAGDIDGKWTGDVQTPDGNSISLTMSFATDGDKVNGTISGPTGDVAIAEGKMDGDTLTFKLDVDANGTQLSFKCTGKLKADELAMKMDGGSDLNLEFTAKRAAAK
jgi:hypothetical protein